MPVKGYNEFSLFRLFWPGIWRRRPYGLWGTRNYWQLFVGTSQIFWEGRRRSVKESPPALSMVWHLILAPVYFFARFHTAKVCPLPAGAANSLGRSPSGA
jgi:hypothetical protein